MSQQLYFVMPLNGALEKYENFERLFAFYPSGVKGLILEYVLLYSLTRNIVCQETPRGCDAGTGTLEEEMLDKVLALYEKSWEYNANQHAYPNCQAEFTIEMVCTDIAVMISQAVEEHRVYFNCLDISSEHEEALFFGDNAAMKVAVRLPTIRH